MKRKIAQLFFDLKNKELMRIRFIRFFQELKSQIPVRFKFQRLHVFYNETDFYIAFDFDDAEKAVFDTVGETRLEMEGEQVKDNPFKLMKDKTEITISIDPCDYNPLRNPMFAKVKHDKDGDYFIVTAPAWAWILVSGRGMLCSSEW